MLRGFAEPDRDQMAGEEVANCISHGVGLIAALVGMPFLVLRSIRYGTAGYVVGSTLFAVSITLLYFASTLYHALPQGKGKRVFQIVEHAAIFLLIAGTYTPFTLGVLRGGWGWALLGVVWGLAAVGVALRVVHRSVSPLCFVGLYLLMGWVIVVAIDPLLERLPSAGLALLVAGGVSYTVGVAFFVADSRMRYGHFIWHLFVLCGTVCHFFAVLWYGA